MPRANRLDEVMKQVSRKRRVYPLWVDERDTPADIEAKRKRLSRPAAQASTTNSCVSVGNVAAKAESISGGLRYQPAAVEDDRRRGSPVSGLFFTGNRATQACDAEAAALAPPSRGYGFRARGRFARAPE
jgi:hypothetical protein